MAERSEPRKNSHSRPAASRRNNPVRTERDFNLDPMDTVRLRETFEVDPPQRGLRFTKIGPESQTSPALSVVGRERRETESWRVNIKGQEHSRTKVRFGR